LEEFEIARAMALPNLDLRFKNKVVSVAPQGNGATLQVETPDGIYSVETDWLVVADGARSTVRRMMNLEMDGKIFMDRFLIADVVMKADFPHERWFWFDPPFHPGQSVLLHRQADNVYRIDFQLGWDADPEEEKKPEKVIPRIKSMLGDDREFELEWVSVYTFQCRRMAAFTHGHVLFAGDVAHQVSPFGARGANSGIQDTDNLCWKLKLVIDGKAPASLLDTYSEERTFAADENLMNSTRSTDFITPKSKTSLTFRNAVLSLARQHKFARALVNSGRLSVPAYLTESRLNSPDGDVFDGDMVPGAPMDDAPMQMAGKDVWLLDQIGNRFMALVCVDDLSTLTVEQLAMFQGLAGADIPVEVVLIAARAGAALPDVRVLVDRAGRFAERFDARVGTTYLIRPDQHVAGRWRAWDDRKIRAAVARATCNQH
jgi:3-(3-hydroxy-phenyl)propionate hydroxylase